MNAVEAHSVTRRFGSFTAVDDFDLVVEPGEVVGLVGANGAGKTTLIKMVLGLLLPTSGSVRLFGEVPTREQRRRIGYVPQNLGLYPDLTIEENLEFRGEVFGNRAGAVHVEDEAPGLVGSLSLGVQRRAAFTAAIQHGPDLLMLDEPTSGVSPLARSVLWDLIRSRADAGAAVLVSTHYMDEAVQADRLLVMARSRLVAQGSLADVVGNRSVVEITTDRWSEAFDTLDHDDRRLILSGRRIRVLGDPPEVIRAELTAAGITAEVQRVGATLDEVMVEMST